MLCLLVLLGWGMGTPHSCNAETAIESLQVGFEGRVVLGRWVPFSIRLTTPAPVARIQLETLDGDAVPIRYEQTVAAGASRSGSPAAVDPGLRAGLMRLGRASGIQVRLLDDQGMEIASRRFSLDELRETHTFLPGTTRLTLFPLWQQDLPVDENTVPQVERHLADETAIVREGQLLPEHWMGYDSVRTMLLMPDPAWASLTDAQRGAIEDWVRQGGRLLITGGDAFDSRFATALGDLSPGAFESRQVISDTGSIELFTKSNEQLVKPAGPQLAVTVVNFENRERRLVGRAADHPLIMHWIHGFGRVSFICLDFTSEPLVSWDGRRRLLTLALDATAEAPSESAGTRVGRVSHIGFTDIVGQLRAAMDQFKRVSFITFTLVALLVGLFILAIGPGDFLFLRRIVGRMELTWLTFSLICLAFCLLAWWLATQLKSAETEINQVEIIDVDAATQMVRGNVWAHLYSPRTATYDIHLPRQNSLFGPLDQGWLGWQGLPGGGLGSMQSRTDLGLYRRQYECVIDPRGSHLRNLPMQNAATKALHALWTGRLENSIRSGLRQSPTSDALLGTVTNPLDQPLVDCVLLYGDWVYQLQDRPLEANETIVVEDDLREKTIAAHFTRLGSRGDDEVSTAWDTNSTRLPRILQMMSFFDAIGGQTYTQLTHDYHPAIDFSYQLQMGRAVLIGQIRQVTTPLTVDDQPFQNYDQRLSMVRIVLPVQPRK